MKPENSSSEADNITRFDEKIERLVKKKEEYIKKFEERRDKHVPRLQKSISTGISVVSKKLEMMKRWELKKIELDERIKVLELQIRDRRKVIQKAQEKVREYETCEPGMSKLSLTEREKTDE